MIRSGLGAVSAACVALLVAGTAEAATAPPQTLYRHARLIDGTGGPMRPGMSVLVEGERIKAVAPDTELAAPAGARIVDLNGRYLLPGLINSHEHLATRPTAARPRPTCAATSMAA